MGPMLAGWAWDIERDDGRQLRTASYTPTQSGIYYLQVTRVRDDQPVWRDESKGWSLEIHNDRGDQENYHAGVRGVWA